MNCIAYVNRLLVLSVLTMLAPGFASAQGYPTKPIRIVIGTAPDLGPRLIGQKLAEQWGQQVIIDQRPAAGGIVAAEFAAKAAPDGYTWLLSASTYVIISKLYANVPFDFERDFAPVTLMATLPYIAVVNPSVPAQSLKELVALARANPGKLNFASGGNGTATQITAELFKSNAKIDIVHVPYKGVGPAVTDLIGGQVQLMFAIAQSVVPYVKSGKLRALAITSAKRSVAVPEVPTIAESGYPEMDVVGWNGVHVPAKTPRAIIQKINRDIAQVLKMPEINERLVAAGFEPALTTVEQFEDFVQKDFSRYDKVIKESHIRIE